MRRLGLTLASLALLLTACGGSDGDGSDDGSSPSADESSQDATTPSDDAESDDAESEDAESEDAESDDGEPTETGTVEELEEAFTKYTKAFFQGKADKAIEYYTENCQAQLAPEEFAAAASSVKDTYAADFKLTITSSDVKDDTGKVEATYGIPEVDEVHAADGYDWLFEDGEWRLDGCF